MACGLLLPSLLQADQAALLETLKASAATAAEGAKKISAERQKVLDPAAEFIAKKVAAKEPVQLNFICTHNSRRSHLSQVWAQTAATYYDVPGVETYSGGVEATACNVRTVRAMRRAGFSIAAANAEKNPLYLVQYAEAEPPLNAWSKVYLDPKNPKSGYGAMMCCDDVDEKCPTVEGSAIRIPLHYKDPKVADNTDQEANSYDTASKLIATEMFYLMSKAAEIAKKNT